MQEDAPRSELSDTSFDVVVVPDFRAKSRDVFEAHMIWFLSSWIEYAGRARSFPLHIACIEDPPARVRTLAEKCGALVTTHEPMAGLGELNQLTRRLRRVQPHVTQSFKGTTG